MAGAKKKLTLWEVNGKLTKAGKKAAAKKPGGLTRIPDKKKPGASTRPKPGGPVKPKPVRGR